MTALLRLDFVIPNRTSRGYQATVSTMKTLLAEASVKSVSRTCSWCTPQGRTDKRAAMLPDAAPLDSETILRPARTISRTLNSRK